MPITREQLYEDVWATPMTSLLTKYKVSSAYLARVCARLNVPRPPRGYWARVRVGKAGPKPPLPAPLPGDELDWLSGRDSRYQTFARTPPVLPEAPSNTPVIRKRVRRQALHQLILGARDHFLNGREPARYTSAVPYLRPYKQKLVDVVVTKEVLDVALREANQLFQVLEARGHRVILAPFNSSFRYLRKSLDCKENPSDENSEHAWSPMAPTIVFVGNVAFGLTIYEMSEEVRVRYIDGKYVRAGEIAADRQPKARYGMRDEVLTRAMPSGRLAIRAYSPYPRVHWEKFWRSTRRGSRPALPDEVAHSIEAAAPANAESFAQAERERVEEQVRYEAWQRELQRQEDERRLLHATEESRKHLLGVVDSWALARSIESFFADATERVRALPEDERELLLQRVEEARILIGGVDPLKYFRAWRTPAERLEHRGPAV